MHIFNDIHMNDVKDISERFLASIGGFLWIIKVIVDLNRVTYCSASNISSVKHFLLLISDCSEGEFSSRKALLSYWLLYKAIQHFYHSSWFASRTQDKISHIFGRKNTDVESAISIWSTCKNSDKFNFIMLRDKISSWMIERYVYIKIISNLALSLTTSLSMLSKAWWYSCSYPLYESKVHFEIASVY